VLSNGFTLVEVMVSLLIFGMLAAAGVALLSFSVRAQGVTAAKIDETTAIVRLSSAMMADFAQAVDRRSRDRGGASGPAFVGAETGEGAAVRMVRDGWTNIDAAPRSSLQTVAYRLNGTVLERVAWPFVDGAEPLPATAMLDDVTQMALRYRYAGAWSDRWDGATGPALPDAAELVVVRRDGQRYRMVFVVGTHRRPRPGEAPANAPPA
jgi:general secretion pathway protein J